MVKSDVVRDVDHLLSVYFPITYQCNWGEMSLQSLRYDPMTPKRIGL
jgi:hypothetical protein